MAKRDFYQVLGAQKGAGAAELKASYRKLAMEFHPDRNPDDPAAEARFKELGEAYDVLKDDQKRAAYDRFGHAAFEGTGQRPSPRPDPFADIFSKGFGDDIFDDLFGARRSTTRSSSNFRSSANPAKPIDELIKDFNTRPTHADASELMSILNAQPASATRYLAEISNDALADYTGESLRLRLIKMQPQAYAAKMATRPSGDQKLSPIRKTAG